MKVLTSSVQTIYFKRPLAIGHWLLAVGCWRLARVLADLQSASIDYRHL